VTSGGNAGFPPAVPIADSEPSTTMTARFNPRSVTARMPAARDRAGISPLATAVENRSVMFHTPSKCRPR
jgi:hypothetical protein